jgi:ribose transport system substrate-binding protein
MMEDLITQQVDALCVAPSQPKAAVKVFDKAAEAGIPVILIDTDAPWEKKASFIGTGNYSAGKIAGEYLVNNLPKGAKIVIIRGALGDLTHDDRTNGAKDVMDEGGLEVIDIQPADSDRNKALNVMENMLQKFDKIDAVFTTNDPMGLGALRAIRQAGQEIIVIGFDGTPDAQKEIKKGRLTGSVAQSPYNMGYFGVENAVKLAKGETIENRIDTGAELITQENVEEIEALYKKLLGK